MTLRVRLIEQLIGALAAWRDDRLPDSAEQALAWR